MVSVVIVTYNSGLDVVRCIDSLSQGLTDPFDVVVVDNASTDGLVAELRRRAQLIDGASGFGSVSIIELDTNKGFATAANVGILATDSPYVLILNPDTIVLPGSIDQLLAFAQSSPDVGVVSPRLQFPDGRDQRTARSFPTMAAGLFGRRSFLTKQFPQNRWSAQFLGTGAEGSDDQPFRCDWVSGACMLIPRSVVERTGGFDEGYFLFWEDADWCKRIAQLGLAVWTIPLATVVHREGGSRKGWPPQVIRHFHRGAYRYWTRFHAPHWWNLSRWFAASALATRAGVLIVAHRLTTKTASQRSKGTPSWAH